MTSQKTSSLADHQKPFYEKIVFGIGSNLKDREKNLKMAISHLQEELSLRSLKSSKIFQNSAILPENAPPEWNLDFLNIAISAEIKISSEINQFAEEALKIVKKIEKKIGRKERQRWAPREIDIDILAIGIHQIYSQTLQIPHIGTFEREFFAKTFQEIEPEMFAKLHKMTNL